MRAWSAAAVLGVMVAGRPAGAQGHSEPVSSAAEPRPSHPTAAGTLAAWDPVTRLLTVRNATGSREFHVSADARFWLGNRRLPIVQLGSHVGAQVTVAWSEADGVRTTHTVRVADTPPVRVK
jgi:hypothetical protein